MRSSRPFPHLGARVDDGTGIPPGYIPLWLAQTVYARLRTVSRGEFDVPSLVDIERRGGFAPLQILDLIAGGRGDGLTWVAIMKRRHSIIDREIIPQIEVIKDLTPRMIADLRTGH